MHFLNYRLEVGFSLVLLDRLCISGLIGNHSDQCLVRILEVNDIIILTNSNDIIKKQTSTTARKMKFGFINAERNSLA